MNNKYCILIVNDNKEILKMLTGALEEEYNLITSESGEDALLRAAADCPDMILMDIFLPDADGFEVFERLRNAEETRRIPVIFMSDSGDAKHEEKGLAVGGVDFIAKPFNVPVIKARVKSHMHTVIQMRAIEDLSGLDALTGIPNRRRFDERMAMEWTRSKRSLCPLSVLIMDIDDFKRFNDLYGHAQGDAVLQIVGKTAMESARRPGDMAARWGGEEFAIILPDTNLAGAIKIAETIRANVQAATVPNINSKGAPLSVTVSVGAECSASQGVESKFDLVVKADRHMYAAKEAGKNRIYPPISG